MEKEQRDKFRLLVSSHEDVPRGFFQFGPLGQHELITMYFGSLTEIGDAWALGGIIDHLECKDVKGDFYIVTNPLDADDLLKAMAHEE